MAFYICRELSYSISSVSIYYVPESDILVKSYDHFEFLEIFHCSSSSHSLYHVPHTYTRVKSYGHLNLPRAFVLSLKHLDILCAWIEHPREKLWLFEFLESFRCSFFSISIYHGPHTYTRVKSYGRLNLPRAFMFYFERLDIFCTSIENPSEMLWRFEFLESLRCSLLSSSIYHGPYTYCRIKSYGRLNLSRHSVFNYNGLDILCAWIKFRVKWYDHLNFSRASVVHFRASRYTMGLTHTPE